MGSTLHSVIAAIALPIKDMAACSSDLSDRMLRGLRCIEPHVRASEADMIKQAIHDIREAAAALRKSMEDVSFVFDGIVMLACKEALPPPPSQRQPSHEADSSSVLTAATPVREQPLTKAGAKSTPYQRAQVPPSALKQSPSGLLERSLPAASDHNSSFLYDHDSPDVLEAAAAAASQTAAQEAEPSSHGPGIIKLSDTDCEKAAWFSCTICSMSFPARQLLERSKEFELHDVSLLLPASWQEQPGWSYPKVVLSRRGVFPSVILSEENAVVKYSVSDRFAFDAYGRPKFNLVVEVGPQLCRILEECDKKLQEAWDSIFISKQGEEGDYCPGGLPPRLRPTVMSSKEGFGQRLSGSSDDEKKFIRLKIITQTDHESRSFYVTKFYQAAHSKQPGTDLPLIPKAVLPSELRLLLPPCSSISIQFCVGTYCMEGYYGLRLMAHSITVL